MVCLASWRGLPDVSYRPSHPVPDEPALGVVAVAEVRAIEMETRQAFPWLVG